MSKRSNVELGWLKEYMDKAEALSVVFPSLTNLAVNHTEDFRGLTVFQGDNNSIVVGVKRWSGDGQPEIMWSSGRDFLDAMLSLDKALRKGNWRTDKRSK